MFVVFEIVFEPQISLSNKTRLLSSKQCGIGPSLVIGRPAPVSGGGGVVVRNLARLTLSYARRSLAPSARAHSISEKETR